MSKKLAMDRMSGKKVTIEHISYEVENVKLLDINTEALVYEDEDGKHLFRIEDVPLIYRCERDITDKHMGSFKKKVKFKAVFVYSFVFSLPSLIALGVWWVIR